MDMMMDNWHWACHVTYRLWKIEKNLSALLDFSDLNIVFCFVILIFSWFKGISIHTFEYPILDV